MDEYESGFGELSTSAAEWTPSSGWKPKTQPSLFSNSTESSDAQDESTGQSDLNAASVKEFVPGQGWRKDSLREPSASLSDRARPFQPSVISTAAPRGYGSSLTATAPGGPSLHQQQIAESTKDVLLPPLSAIRSLESIALPTDIWQHQQTSSLQAARVMDPSDERHKAVPPPYYNAYCLDDDTQHPHNRGPRHSLVFGCPSQTFKVQSHDDDRNNTEFCYYYTLRRYDTPTLMPPTVTDTVTERWTIATDTNRHPNVVPFHRCFCAQGAVFFVYDYIPGNARTLQDRLQEMGGGILPEALVWSCVTQIVSAIRTIHREQMAVRCLRLSQILVVPSSSSAGAVGTAENWRLRINSLGVKDVLEFNPDVQRHRAGSVVEQQRQDIRDLGYLILSLATGFEITAADRMEQSGMYVRQNYSSELHTLALTLIRSAPHPPTIVDVARSLALRTFDEQDAAYRSLDRTERALSMEYDAGRILRVLLKLGLAEQRLEWLQQAGVTPNTQVLSQFRQYGKKRSSDSCVHFRMVCTCLITYILPFSLSPGRRCRISCTKHPTHHYCASKARHSGHRVYWYFRSKQWIRDDYLLCSGCALLREFLSRAVSWADVPAILRRETTTTETYEQHNACI